LLVGTYRHNIDLTILAVIIPLLVITYLTFRTALARLHDTTVHISQLNALYLSTIEALAMAVDAKDQITHGHIRRVQVYALELAKSLGLADQAQLTALEAAALLHDVGKLAIPEHILNKPGKLTTAEFETMKRHADIGADLLSSIRFPYPVVPIVRHHHENWDGSGYPLGIAGTDIPLGARILSVVDCFDALNSDRPYRPRLSVDDAFGILKDRRGTMYDPVVVDTFVKVYPDIIGIGVNTGERVKSIFVEDDARSRTGPLAEIRAHSADATALMIARTKVQHATNAADALSTISQAVRQFTPSTACVYFEYRPMNNALVCTHVSSDTYKNILGFSMRPGERVTGWAAVNLRTISNSPATLDLGEAAGLVEPIPVCTLSTPVLDTTDARMLGVLTAYSPRVDAFTHRHVYAFEQLAAGLAEFLSKRQLCDQPLLAAPATARLD
jgi:putative nucleotidyltransferase with HDIG domain